MFKTPYEYDLWQAASLQRCSEAFILSELNDAAYDIMFRVNTGMKPYYRSLFRQFWLALKMKRKQIPMPRTIFQ